LVDVLAVVPDRRFGGGSQAMVDAFVMGVERVGRRPATITPGFVPAVDAANQLLAGVRLAPRAREARALWVVGAAASYGFAAARSGRSYNCWVATSLAAEWSSRSESLSPLRRVAHRANARALLAIERRVLGKADRVFGISPSSREDLRRAAGRGDVEVLPIPVDVEHFVPAKEDEWLARLEAPVVAFVGRADDPRKNVGLLLAAWPRIRRRIPRARLRLIGRPPLGPLPEGVEAAGQVEDVAVALRDATLLVLPSLQEGFGIVVAEALAAGVPAVTTPSGGPEELVRASGGGRVLGGFDPQELAETVVSLLADRDGLLQLRACGRDYVVREHAPARLEELLSPLLS
jgi:glycosyltransferase involved in cell wall biosynthesis